MPTFPIPDPHSLLQRVRTGDAAAFETIFRAYSAPVFRFALSFTSDRDAAEDLVQDVFSWVWANRTTWAPDDMLAYLLATVRNRALDRVRQRKRRERMEDTFTHDNHSPAMGEPVPSPEATTELHDWETRVAHALASLPEAQRTTLFLRWQHDMPWHRIASILGMSHDAVRQQHSRTMTRLRQQFPDLLE